MGWKLRSLALGVFLYQVVQMVLQGIKDGVDIQDNHQSYSKTFMYYFLLGLMCWYGLYSCLVVYLQLAFWLKHLIQSMFSTFCLRHALTAAVWKVLSAALDLLMRRKSPQVRNFSQANEHRPGQLLPESWSRAVFAITVCTVYMSM